jgi:hypothetical protein
VSTFDKYIMLTEHIIIESAAIELAKVIEELRIEIKELKAQIAELKAR